LPLLVVQAAATDVLIRVEVVSLILLTFCEGDDD
jgi:hypothetical protein